MYRVSALGFRSFFAVGLILLGVLTAAPAVAQSYRHAVLIDSDDNAATGCTVNSAAGTVSGIDLRIDADVSGLPPQVDSVSRSECVGVTFASPVTLGGGYPVALDGGVGAADAIELAMAYADVPDPGQNWRIAMLSESATGADLLGPFTATGLGNAPLPSPIEEPALIPSLSPGGVIGLSVIMAVLLLWGARRHRGLLSVFMLCGSLAFFGVAWAANFIADGNLGDWIGEAANAGDPNGDASSGEMPIDIVAGFARREGGNVFFRIDVNDAESTNRTPAIADQGFSIDEDSANGAAVGSVVASDPDAGDTLAYAITAGNAAGVFAIDANSGAISVVDNSGLDFETTASYALTVSVTDDGTPAASSSATVSISVNDINETPAIADQGFSVIEDSADATVVGSVVASDPDSSAPNNTLSYAITAGNTGTAFAIDAAGQISITSSAAITAANSPFSLTVEVSDGGGLSASATVTVTVIAINHAPGFTAGANQSVLEDAGAQTVTGWATAIDDGDGGSQNLTFNITANDNPALFSVAPAIDATSGNLTYSAAADANGVANLSITLGDDGGTANGGVDSSAPVNISITVNAVNDAPAFTAGANESVFEDSGAHSVPGWATAISAGPADEGTQTLGFAVTGNTNAALFSVPPSVAGDGTLSYTLAASVNGSADITVLLNDDGGTANGGVDTSAPQTFTITVATINHAPSFSSGGNVSSNEDDGAQTVTGWATAIDDGDGGGQILSFNVTGNDNAALFSAAPGVDPVTGNLTYTAAADASGVANLTLTLSDDGGTANGGVDSSAQVNFSITVDPVNDAPVAVADSHTVAEGGTLTTSAPGVLANDTDAEGAALTAILVTGPASASAFTLNANGSFSYIHDGSETTTDSFTYRANDGVVDSNIVTVTITITSVNDPPVAVTDSYTTTEDAALNVPVPGVLANDSDPEGGSLTVTAFDAVSSLGVSVSMNADGSFSYDPSGSVTLQALPVGESASDTFTYFVEDSGGDSDTAVVSVTVTGVNDAPVAVGNGYSVAEGGTLNPSAPGVLDGDTDAEGDALTAVLATGPASASSFTLNVDGSFSYIHDGSETTTDSFTYRANDDVIDSNIATVTITITSVNDTPVAVADSFSTTEDTPLTVPAPGVLGNDSDAEGSLLTAALATGPSNGSLVFNADGSFSYTPNANYFGGDVFTYTASDGTGNSAAVPVTITVTLVDDPPVAVDDTATITEDDPVTAITVLANDTDPDAGAISIGIVTQPANGTAAITGGGTGLTYQPDPDYCNDGVTTDNFSYTLTPGGSSATVSVTVTCVNDPPVVTAPVPFSVTGNVRIQVPDGVSDLLAGASDPEGTALSIGGTVPTATAQGGDLSINTTTGSFSYNPPPGYEGPDSFSYDVCDADAGCTSATVNLAVSGMVWFVDPAAGAGDGRLATPFNNITALQSANGGASGPAANESIFLYSGSHSGSLTLLAGQRVYGQGATPSLAALTGITLPTFSDAFPATGGAHPVWTASDAVALTLGSGNTIRGFDIAGTGAGGTDIAGTGFGTLTVDEVTLSGNGRALNLDNGVMAGAGFDAVSVFGSDTQGIRLNTVTGTVALGGGLITFTTGTSFEATGNLGTVTYGGGIVKASTGRLLDISGAGGGNITLSGNLECQADCGTGAGEQVVRIANRSSGSVTMSGISSTLRPTTASGNTIVLIDSNAGASINLSGAIFVGSPSNPVQGTAYQIAGGGTISLNGQIEADTTGARAFDIDGVTLSGNMGGQIATNGALGTAPAIEITSSAAPTGITFGQQLILDNDDSGENGGGLRLHGNSGSYSFPSVARITSQNAMAVDIDNSGTVGMGSVSPGQAANSGGTVISVINTNIAASGMTVTNVRSSGGSSGIVLNNTGSLGSFSITGNGGACASTATCTGGVIQSTTDVGVSLTSTLTPSLAHLYVGATGSHGIHAASLSNGLTLTDVMVEDAGNADNEYGLNVQNVAGTVNITDSLFDNAADDLIHYVNTNTNGALTVTGSSFVHPATISPTANAAIAMQPNGSSTLTATITGNGFTDIRGDSIQWGAATAGSTGTSTLQFSGNTITVNTAGRASGFSLSGQESTTGNILITGNVFNGAGGNGVISIDTNDQSLIAGDVSGNTISTPPGTGLFLAVDEAAEARVSIDNNQINSSGGDGIQLVSFGGLGVSGLFAAVTNNTVNGHSLNTLANFLGGISVISFEDDACVEIRNNQVIGTPVSPTQCGGLPCVDYYVEEVGGVMQVEEVPNTADTTLNAAYLNSINDAGPVTLFGSIDLTNGAQCPFP